MPRYKFKRRYWYFADTPNIGRSYSVIWKDLWWRADSYRLLKYRGGCIIPLFQLSVWCEKCVAARHYGVIGKQLFISNDRQRVRWEVLGLSQDGVCTDSFVNFSVKSWKRDQSNDTKFNPPLSPWSIPLICTVPKSIRVGFCNLFNYFSNVCIILSYFCKHE